MMLMMKEPAASADCRCSVSTKQRARKGNGRNNRRGRGRRRRRKQYDPPVHHHHPAASMFERSWDPRLVGGWRNLSEVRRSASSSSPQSIRYHSQFQSSHVVDLGLLISAPGRSMISESLLVRDSILSTRFLSRQSKLKQTSISQSYRTSTTSSCRAVRIM
jgi:hypothetical protein